MAAPRVQLRLLGGFDAQFGGVAIDIAARKTRALLAYLALSAGQAHSREKLAALLWSDRGDKQAHSSLRQALVELGRAFEAIQLSPLIKRQDTIAIDPAAVEVDALAFERLAASDDADDLRNAAVLYGGDLLDGIGVRDPAFEEWLLMERTLQRELNTEPSLETEALHREIRHRSREAGPQRKMESPVSTSPVQPLRASAQPSSKPSVAVLPFRNLSGNPDQQYA